MAITRVQGAGITETAQATTLALTGANSSWASSTAGTCLALHINMHGTGSFTITSVVDNLGSTWIQGPHTNGNGACSAIYYLPNNPGGVTSITVTGSITCTIALWCSEWSGVASASVVDGTPVAGGPTTSASISSGAYTTANAADVLLGLIGWQNTSGTLTAGPTFGSGTITQEALQQSRTGTQPCSMQPVYQVLSATGTWTLTATLSAAAYWTADVLALKAASAGGTESSSLQAGFVVPGSMSAQTYSGTLNAAEDWVAGIASYSPATASVPAAVATPTASPGNAVVALSWPTPSNGGSAITSYTITPYIAGVAQTAVTGIAPGPNYAVTPYTLTAAVGNGHIINATAYTFTVKAINAVGTGAASSQSSAVTPVSSTVPATPAAPSVTPGDTVAAVTITPPSNGGAAILTYTFNCYQSGALFATVTQASDVYTFTGLTDGLLYGFSGIATNANGNSIESTPTTAMPEPAASTTVMEVAGPTTTVGDRLQNVKTASRQLSDGTLVFLAYDPSLSTPNQVGLYYSSDHSTPNLVATISSTYFALTGLPQALVLVVDASENIFVIGSAPAPAYSSVVVQAFTFTGQAGISWSWTAQQVVSQSATAWAGAPGTTLAGFAAVWCATTLTGHIMLLVDRSDGTHFAAVLDAGILLNNAYSGVVFIVNADQPSFLASSGNGSSTGSNLSISQDGAGANNGLCVTAASATSVQVASWGLTSSGQFTTGAGVYTDTEPTATLTTSTQVRVARISSGTWIVVVPSASAGNLDAYLYSSSYDGQPGEGSVGFAMAFIPSSGTPGPMSSTIGSGLAWDLVAAPTTTVPAAAWVYGWSTQSGHLDDLLRFPLTVIISGTYYVGAGAVQTPYATPWLDSPGFAGGAGTVSDYGDFRVVREPVDLIHVDWETYDQTTPYGLVGSFSSLPSAPNTPTLLAPASGTQPSQSGGIINLNWLFTSSMPSDNQTGVYVRRSSSAGYQWWTGSAWTSPQSGATLGNETIVLTSAGAVATGSWTVGTRYTWSAQTVGATGLLSGYAVDASFTAANAAPPTPSFTPAPAYNAATNQTTVTLTLDPSDTTSAYGSIEFSDDSGVTWNSLNTDVTQFPWTQIDWDTNPAVTRQYRIQTWTGSPSGYSAYAYATVVTPLTMSWLVDPADGTSMMVNIVPGTFHMHRLEDLTVQYPLGRQFPVVVYGEIHGDDIEVTFITQSIPEEAALLNLLNRQTVLLLMTPEPGSWYVRRTTEVTTNRPSRMAAPHRLHPETFVQMPRPTPGL